MIRRAHRLPEMLAAWHEENALRCVLSSAAEWVEFRELFLNGGKRERVIRLVAGQSTA
jgi:hypothetical protein